MYALARLGPRRFCVAGVGLEVLQGVGCTLWRVWVSAAFAWQGWDWRYFKGSDVRFGAFGSPPLLCGRGGTGGTARGRMYALARLGLRRFCVAGVGLEVLQGVGCTLWRVWVPAAFAWQAWDWRVGCTLWRVWVSAAFPWQAWDWRYFKGSDVRRFCVAGLGLEVLQGVGCTLWRLWVPAAFAWQAWGWRYFKGSDVRFGAFGSPPLLRGRRGTGGTSRGRMYALARLGFRRFCVAGVGLEVLQGVGCTLWRLGVSAAFVWQAWGWRYFKGSDVRFGAFGSPPLLRGRCGACGASRGLMYAILRRCLPGVRVWRIGLCTLRSGCSG